MASRNHRLSAIRRSFVATTAGIALVISQPGCERYSSAFPLSVEEVRKLDTSSTKNFSFAESHGAILVTIGDKHGDAHVHEMSYAPLTKRQALELLRQKQLELERSH